MGIMTGGTAFGHCRVHVRHAGQNLLVIVAHKAEQVPFFSQLIGGVRRMYVMTTLAVSCGNRTMNQLLVGLIIMTLVAEFLPEGGQHALLFPLVRIVAVGTVAIGNGSMSVRFTRGLVFVTLITEGRHSINQQGRLLARMRVVTGETIAINHRRVTVHPLATGFWIMALIAEFAAIGRKHLARVAAMGVMTSSTTVL